MGLTVNTKRIMNVFRPRLKRLCFRAPALRQRLRRKLVFLSRLVAMTLLFVFFVAFVTPARNVVGYFILPASWSQLSSGQILHMFYLEEQRFPVEMGEGLTCDAVEPTISSVNWQQIIDDMPNLPAYDSDYYSNIASNPGLYGTSPELVQGILERYSSFKPPMSGKWQRKLRMTFKVFALAMKVFNVTYFLCEGTMLGVYRHHGYIPWDDDMDLCMNGTDWLKVKQILHCIPGFDVDTRSYMMYKFFWQQSDTIQGDPLLRVPYIDIFFFTENEEYIWALSRIKKHRIVFKKDVIFPLTWRPFEDMLAPVPRRFEHLCTTMYNPSTCVSRDFDHLKDRPMIPFYEYQYISCDVFKPIYPFVDRENVSVSGRQVTVEYKRIGKKLLGNFTAL